MCSAEPPDRGEGYNQTSNMGCPFLVIIFGLYDYKICYNVAVLAATSLHSSMENLLQKQMKVTVVEMLNYLRISTETECEAKAA